MVALTTHLSLASAMTGCTEYTVCRFAVIRRSPNCFLIDPWIILRTQDVRTKSPTSQDVLVPRSFYCGLSTRDLVLLSDIAFPNNQTILFWGRLPGRRQISRSIPHLHCFPPDYLPIVTCSKASCFAEGETTYQYHTSTGKGNG
jgi:hypothetical protein